MGEFQWDDALGLAIAAMAAVLFAIAARAYWRTRTTRVLLFAAAFGMFFAKGLLKVAEVFWLGEGPGIDGAELVAEAAALGLFFAATIQR